MLVISRLHLAKNCNIVISVWFLISIACISVAWIMREINIRESYYDYAYQDGKLIAGTVFASYPDNVPGIGWIN